ncbi:hypothetical protein [Natrinema sp. 74]|uniref:DUF7115 domain-containing protein n=1 Tax=Natrinema sp. 74 TaxID=3384159 RepID=UPI0038D356D2
MSVPGIVHSTLDGEEIAARVSLGSDDELFITPTRTIVYRADGLLSDESADKYPHDADRLTLSEGRRKTKFSLEYALDGPREFTIPAGKTDAVLHPVLAGVLNGNEITDSGETVAKTYRFSELTLIITSDRLVKHIGGAVWDDDYEEYHFDDVTNLSFEDGSVATQIVLTVDGRPQRIKAPNEEANDLRERLQRALFDYHGVGSLEELNDTLGGDGDEAADSNGAVDFGGGVDPLDADPPEPEGDERRDEASAAGKSDAADPLADIGADDSAAATPSAAESDDQSAATPSQSVSATGGDYDAEEVATETEAILADAAADAAASSSAGDEVPTAAETGQGAAAPAPETDPELLERIEALEETVERQSELIEQQGETIDRLIEELRQGR